MSYGMILAKFRVCMEDIGNALREVLGTDQKYKFIDVAEQIRTCNQVFYLGKGMSFNVSHIPGYQNKMESGIKKLVVAVTELRTLLGSDDLSKGNIISAIKQFT